MQVPTPLHCVQQVFNGASMDHTFSSMHYNPRIYRNPSPPWREDSKDGHYVFSIGENLTFRYRILSKIGEG
ncbi:hypothetical protein ZOSMA_7444G00010 [Zostera marina]|uniref:Uncharacterized protein n=1 Tax=Zostera marina TaxID=29655 RepID=A0A0K9NPS8_ZOSMR|nr:hypothetical protein ZOSMA_7444G00010 [Zostera marina]